MLSSLFSISLSVATTLFFAWSSAALAAAPGSETISARLSNSVPTVTLDRGTFTGTAVETVEQFLGIPYAKPPTGDLRLRVAVPIPAYTGNFQATSYGNSCPQQMSQDFDFSTLPPAVLAFLGPPPVIGQQSEDCLTINVIRPAGTTSTSRLPVALWIYGGGFQTGSTISFDGTPIVNRSVAIGSPLIYVSMNYRLSGFGFLAGKEIKSAGLGNLGLRDQREAMRWVQKYITAFGGDSTKVTIWGESAGAISVALQMVANNGNQENLFRAGFMQSGSVPPFGDAASPQSQAAFDTVASQAGCAAAADKLACLRLVPYEQLKAVFDAGPGLFNFKSLVASWTPRADGVFITDLPQKLLSQGSITRIPYVNGDCDDEGTLFSFSTQNITTDAEFRDYVKTVYLPSISDADLDAVAKLYPNDVTQGSPFDTGTANALTPQFKRLAAFQGDLVFQGPRRNMLQNTFGKQPSWSFLSKKFKTVPFVGSVHGSDVPVIYNGTDLSHLTDYLINFVISLNPNGKTTTLWPQYILGPLGPGPLLTFLDSSIPRNLTLDTYRESAIALLNRLALQNPL